jgi:PAS domain S-box-containing protein
MGGKPKPARVIRTPENGVPVRGKAHKSVTLRTSERSFLNIIESANDVMYTHDGAGNLTWVNAATCRLSGYTGEELLKMNVLDLVVPEQVPIIRDRWAQRAQGITLGPCTTEWIAKDGRHHILDVSPCVISEDGLPSSILSIGRDITDRIRAERSLVESERKFRVLADSATSAIYIHDGKRFLYSNRASKQISGYTAAELANMSPWDLLHPGDREQVRHRAAQQIHAKEDVQRYELRILTKSGGERWLDFCANLTQFEGRDAVLCTAFDITERKRAEKLQAALYRISDCANSVDDLQQLYRALHEIIGELIYARNLYVALLDEGGEHLHFPYFADEIDRPVDRKLGKGLTEYVLRTGKPLLADSTTLESLDARGETESLGADCVDWLGVPLRQGAKIIGVLALQSYDPNIRYSESDKEILTYVSQHISLAIVRKRQEEALRASEARHRSLVESAVYGMYRSTIDGKFLDVNPALVKMLAYPSAEDLVSVDMARDLYVEPEQRQTVIDAHLQTGHIESCEVRWKRKDGRPITVRLSGNVFKNELGEALGFEMIAEDITERRTLEEQLRQSQKMEAVGRLAGGIAHDFNNLLTVIRGYSELVLDELGSADPLRNEVSEIQKAADRAASLTRQLLAFSRQQVLAPKILDLNLVVNNMDKLLHRLIGEDVDLFTVLEPGLGRVKADPGQIEQVIMNLAVNARDAMPQGGKLTIETANTDLDENYSRDHIAVKPGCYVMIAVSDTGVGMNDKVRARIFEPFFTTKEVGKGTGLGLSTVYGIVKQSGGYVWVYSEVGKGSSFKIYLPRVDAPAELAPSHAGTPARRGTETVLLVEDEDGVRALMRHVLHKHGYYVLEARHGGEALLTCERHQDKIDLLLTDVVLEQMSGRELAQRLQKLRPAMKVLYVSGYADDAIVHHGVLNAGMSFLQKPFTTEALARKIRYILDGPAPDASAQS